VAPQGEVTGPTISKKKPGKKRVRETPETETELGPKRKKEEREFIGLSMDTKGDRGGRSSEPDVP